ncbi:hypothetical protein [Neorhizobium sp. DT-125]|uniref:hypothetical protein n=1 Tax=Neorhizobium sp. DT-125 TaxID=3396163 RepID=UPI003F1B3275
MQSSREPGPIAVLLYAKQPDIAARIGELLTSHGMAVTTAVTVSELQDAAGIGRFDVTAAHTTGIQTIRQITALPVVNIDAFVFQSAARADDTKAASRFDTAAFVKRLFDVASPRKTGRSSSEDEARTVLIDPEGPAR